MVLPELHGKYSGGVMLKWACLLLAMLVLAACGSEGGVGSPRESLFFGAREAEDGRYVLWRTDGTPSGTRLVSMAVSIQQNAVFQKMYPFNGEHYFTAAQPGSQQALWATDGTEAGTRRIHGLLHQGPFSPSGLTATNDSLYFSGSVPGDGTFLWRTDGRPEGTLRLDQAAVANTPPFPSSPVLLGEHLFFIVQSGTSKRALMRLALADGSAGVLREFDRQAVQQVLAYGENLVVDERANGRHRLLLIRPESGESETLLDIPAAAGFPVISTLTVVGNQLYFRARTEAYGDELWVSDGTVAGTRLHTDMTEGIASTYFYSFRAVGQALIIEGAPDGGRRHVWVVDGPDVGPRLLHVASGEVYGSLVAGVYQGSIYFHEKAGEEDYRLCAASLRTGRLRCLEQSEVNPTPGFPISLLNGELLFVASSEGYGREIWKAPVTLSRARRLHDLCPGSCSAF